LLYIAVDLWGDFYVLVEITIY